MIYRDYCEIEKHEKRNLAKGVRCKVFHLKMCLFIHILGKNFFQIAHFEIESRAKHCK